MDEKVKARPASDASGPEVVRGTASGPGTAPSGGDGALITPAAAEGPAEPPPAQASGTREISHIRGRIPEKPKPFIFNPLAPYKGVVRRFLIVYRHVTGLLAGGLLAYVRALPPEKRRGLRAAGRRFSALLVRPFVDRDIVHLPFPAQLRRRLELLGPTYVKLGQIMAIREDLLPRSVTEELKSLFDHLPPIPVEQVRDIIADNLGLPVTSLFRTFEDVPIGSASIGQAHVAHTVAGDKVVVKVIKPGIRDVIMSDLKLLQIVGVFLRWIIPRYQPMQIVKEFSAYTSREIDYTFEADHAEIFAANFQDVPGVVFPKIYRSLSSRNVLTMEFFDGEKPGSPAVRALSDEQRRRIIDLGADAIIRMLYQDGFFHADLHAGNMVIFVEEPLRIGFIDLGMVGRFEEKTKRRMLYYFNALVSGDIEGATRYLTDMATVGEGGDPHGFRRAVADMSRRFSMHSRGGDFSIAQLILESINLGGRHRIFFPVETTLMVKALVTFEGVGRMLDPGLDVSDVSRAHVSQIFKNHFNPNVIGRELMRNVPELIDLLVQTPRLLSDGYKYLEATLDDRVPEKQTAGVRGSIIAGACIIGGVIAFVQGAPTLMWAPLLAISVLFWLFGK